MARRPRRSTAAASRTSSARLRLWLRLLRCTSVIEREMRRACARGSAPPCPASTSGGARARSRDGLTMGELSRRLMVSNGNVTGLVERPRARRPGRRRRSPAPTAARSSSRLTAAGTARIRRPWRARTSAGSTRCSPGLPDGEVETLTRPARRAQAVRAKAAAERSAMKASRDFRPQHFLLGGATTASPPSRSNRPERKNPLTFESYAELRDTFRGLVDCDGRQGGGAHRRRRQLLLGRRRARDHRPADRDATMPGLLRVHPDDRRPGQGDARLPAADRSPRSTASAPAPAPSSPWRRTCASARPRPRSRSCSPASGSPAATWAPARILPRIIGQGRAAELLLTGRIDERRGGRALGLLQPARARASGCSTRRSALARALAAGPTFAHGMTKTHAQPGMGHGRRRGDRGRGAGPGDLHADRGLPARLPTRSSAKRDAGVRGRLRWRDADRSFLDWPFFEDAPPRARASELERWCRGRARGRRATATDVDADLPDAGRARSAEAGWLRHAVPAAYGGAHERLDVRSLCLVRETLARFAGLADFAFAMQGLGSGAISCSAPRRRRRAICRASPQARRSRRSRSPSPRRAPTSRRWPRPRERDGDGYVLDGEKTWISNGGIADFYVVFARTGEAPGAKGLSALRRRRRQRRASTIAERIEVIAPHPLATLRLRRLPRARATRCSASRARASRSPWRRSTSSARRSAPRRSASRAARSTRRSAHASGRAAVRRAARRAPAHPGEARRHGARGRCRGAAGLPRRLGRPGAARITREAAMAKLYATEAAQRVIDDAVQILGGARRRRRPPGRAALSRDPRAAHLRGRHRGPEARHRAPDARRAANERAQRAPEGRQRVG